MIANWARELHLNRVAEGKVRNWGFKHTVIWHDTPNTYYAPHTHEANVTHYILSGTITISFPEDEKPRMYTFGEGSRVPVPAHKPYEMWIGKDGCKMVFGQAAAPGEEAWERKQKTYDEESWGFDERRDARIALAARVLEHRLRTFEGPAGPPG